jgi:hypothetical protein
VEHGRSIDWRHCPVSALLSVELANGFFPMIENAITLRQLDMDVKHKQSL